MTRGPSLDSSTLFHERLDVPHADRADALRELLARATSATEVVAVPSAAVLERREPELELGRAGRLGATKLTRLYVAPHRSYASDRRIGAVLARDVEAGIEARLVYVGGVVSDLESGTVGLDFIVCDDQIVAGWDRGRNLLWISRVQADLTRALELLASIGSVEDVRQNGSSPAVDEPLAESAALSDYIAGTLCSSDCFWYHSMWQYLRLLGLISSPSWHAQFYVRALRELGIRARELRVLISGCADYSMLAHVLTACEAHTRLTCTAVDLCDTPLVMSRWYAAKVASHSSLHTWRGDVRAFGPAGSFDVVTTDAFIPRFETAERRGLFRAWHDLLKPGGRVVTVVRVFAENDPGSVRHGWGPTALAEAARSQAARFQPFLEVTPSTLAERAELFSRSQPHHSVATRDEILRDLGAEGLAVVHAESEDVEALGRKRRFLRLVAEKTTG